jgi:hypothetical protein
MVPGRLPRMRADIAFARSRWAARSTGRASKYHATLVLVVGLVANIPFGVLAKLGLGYLPTQPSTAAGVRPQCQRGRSLHAASRPGCRPERPA